MPVLRPGEKPMSALIGHAQIRRLNAPNREAWLSALVDALRPTIEKVGKLPKLRIACGFPSRKARARNRTIGECWPPHRSADSTIEIFVSPVLDDPFQVAYVTLHELLHAVVGCEHGHRGPFKHAMAQVGLVGPPPHGQPRHARAVR